MKNPSLNTEWIKEVINKFQSITNKFLAETPDISNQYSSLDPMLKQNFDFNISSFISEFIISSLKNLEIYSILSSTKELKLVGPDNFFNRATEERSNSELSREKIMECSLLVDEIQAILKTYQKSQINLSSTENKFMQLKKIMKDDGNKDREKKENDLINGVLDSRAENEKIIKAVE